MVLDFSCLFGGNSCDVSFGTSVDTLPGLDLAQILPEPEIKPPKIEIEPPIQDTFTPSAVVTQLPPPSVTDSRAGEQEQPSETQAPQNQTQTNPENRFTKASPSSLFDPNKNPFTNTPIDFYYNTDIQWSNVTFSTNDFNFDFNAFKDSTVIDLAWVNSTNANFATSNIKFTDVYKIDGFNAKDPSQLTFEEMKSASTELNARLEFLNDSQKRTLSALTKDISNIETIASKNKIDPDQVLQDLLKKEPEKEKYKQFINVAKEQVTTLEAAEFVGKDGIRGSLMSNTENKTIKEFRELSTKLQANQYTSPDEKAQDLKKLIDLQQEIEKSVDFNSAEAKKINTEVKDMLVKQMEENKKLIQTSLNEIPAAYDKRIKELREKKDLSEEEQATLTRYENNRENVLKLVEKAKNSGFDKFAESYSGLIMEIRKTDPERAQELITGIVKGKVAPEIFAESVRNTGNTEDREAATGILHDIYTDRDLANELQVTSKDKDSQIRRIGFDSLVKDLNLSQTTAANLKVEMRELYRDNPSEYNYYYNSSSNYYHSPEQTSTSSGYTQAEISLLPTELDRKIAEGELPSVAASDEALRTFMRETGIFSEPLARLMLNNDVGGLKRYREVAPPR
jgi:hypothetical protein